MEKEDFSKVEGELATRFQLLPKEIQDVITSSDYQMKLFEIAKKHKLTYDQLGAIEMETTLVLLGLSSPKTYGNDFAEQFKRPEGEGVQLVEEIKAQVFDPIHAALMNLYTNDPDEKETNSNAEVVFEKSGVSIQNEQPATTPSVAPTENRDSMLASIENPAPSTPRVLNEIKPAPSSMPISKSASSSIPVPRAPYAGSAPTVDAIKQPTPMTAKPAEDILTGKLGGTFSVPAKETDHSIKNVGTAPAPKAGGDSYREPIE